LTVLFKLHHRVKGGRTKGGRTKSGRTKGGRTRGVRMKGGIIKAVKIIISYLISRKDTSDNYKRESVRFTRASISFICRIIKNPIFR